jgi:hypothetical protein
MGIKFKQVDELQNTFDNLSGDLQGQITSNSEIATGLASGNFNLSGWKYFAGNADFSGAQGILVDPNNIYTPNNVFAGAVKIGYPISTPRSSTPSPDGSLHVSGGQINLEDQVNVKNNSNLIVENGTISGGTGDFYFITGENLAFGSGNFTGSLTVNGGNIEPLTLTGDFDAIDFTVGVGASQAYQEGRLFYDNTNKALATYNDEADITLQIGQEQYVRVRNNIGSTINNGQAVRINGSQGSEAPTITLASADSEDNSQVIGLATHSIENNSFGYVTTHGVVRDLNTLTFSAGEQLFLAVESGALTGVKTSSPNYQVSVGHVIRSHGSEGTILVEPGNPKLAGGDVKNNKAVNVSGITFFEEAVDSAGIICSKNSFVYDTGNDRVGIGTSTPEGILDLSTTVSAPIMPRMTTAQMNAISSPVQGMLIYNTDSGKFAGYTGSWSLLH